MWECINYYISTHNSEVCYFTSRLHLFIHVVQSYWPGSVYDHDLSGFNNILNIHFPFFRFWPHWPDQLNPPVYQSLCHMVFHMNLLYLFSNLPSFSLLWFLLLVLHHWSVVRFCFLFFYLFFYLWKVTRFPILHQPSHSCSGHGILHLGDRANVLLVSLAEIHHLGRNVLRFCCHIGRCFVTNKFDSANIMTSVFFHTVCLFKTAAHTIITKGLDHTYLIIRKSW